MLLISVLGPLTVRRGDDPVKVPAGKTSELLVRLALDPGVTVRSDRLLEELWGDHAAGTRPNTLQSKVAKLRRALGDPDTIVNVDGGYRLAVEPTQVDAYVAVEAAGAARRLLDEAEDRQVIDLCASTLSQFTGELLISAGQESWVEPHRARLEAARLQLLETWCAARLRLGESGEVITDLELMVADHPFHEGLWALLITALYQAGRQAAALAAYQRVRATLADELGLEPGRELQELERQILVHDERLSVTASAPDVRPWEGNLPALSVRLVGRDTEIIALAELVREHRLVEVIGPGGVGKTALALAAGRLVTEPGGVWFIRLEGANTSSEVVDATVAALGVAGGESALLERLKAAATVLIIDNCEHVLGDAADWVRRLLDTVPDARILCTSQAPLDIAGSILFELAPLGLDDAVVLFTERSTARRMRAAGDGDDDLRVLCRALDGLPLAIELAAARTRTLSIEEITQRLDDRFVVLSDPTSHRPERRRALRSTIAWSYDLLFPDDQRGLWALATFAGGAALPAAEFVLSALGVPSEATIDVLGRLAARSLLIVDQTDNASTRYRLLDSIRAFALDAMRDAGQSTAAHDAHAQWFVDASKRSTEGVRSSRQAEHLAFVRDERANIDAALTWTLEHAPQCALEIATGYGWAWVVLGDSRGAQRLLTAIDAAGVHADPRRRSSALLLAGWIEASTGHLEPARRHVLEAAAQAEAVGDVELQARSAYYLAYVVSHHGDFEAGLALTDKSGELYSGLDHPWDLAANGLFATRATISAGDEPRSVRAAEDVQRWLHVVDDPWLHVRGDAMLGELARLQHRFDDAVEHIARAADTSHRLGFRQTEAYQLASLGRALCQTGDYESGSATLARSIGNAEAIGDVRMAALARVHLGHALRALGRVHEARGVLEEATRWHQRAGGGEQARLGECLLAAIEAAGHVPDAPGRLTEILRQARDAGDAPTEVFALDALALAAANAGDSTEAMTLLDSADARIRVASHFIAERDRVDVHAARDALTSESRS